jgi:hypothetical protein
VYLDWELVDVLAVTDASTAAEVRTLIDSGRKDEAIAFLQAADVSDPEVAQLVDDLVTALSRN